MAPAPEGFVGFGCTCVIAAGADVVPCGAGDLGGREFPSGGVVAELPKFVNSPAPECAVGFGGACVTATSIDFVPC